MKSALRFIRKAADGLVVLVMLLLVIASIGFVGNAYPSLHDSEFEFYWEFAGCILWILVPVAAARLMFGTRRGAGYACFVGVLVAIYFPPHILFLYRWDEPRFLSNIMEPVFLALGFFWVLTSLFNFPPILAPSAQPTWRRRCALISGGILVCALGVFLMAMIAVVPDVSGGDCGAGPPRTGPSDSNDAVFIASDAMALNWKPTYQHSPLLHIFGLPTLARVREQFWGLPWIGQRYVLLMRFADWHGEKYFYDGYRPDGIFARFLPVIVYHTCSRTSLVSDAELELRVLKDGPSPTKGRILGHVWNGGGRESEPKIAGIKVTITGPSGTFETTTSEKGCYYVPGLPPGNYSVHFDAPDSMVIAQTYSRFRVDPGEIIECDATLRLPPEKKSP